MHLLKEGHLHLAGESITPQQHKSRDFVSRLVFQVSKSSFQVPSKHTWGVSKTMCFAGMSPRWYVFVLVLVLLLLLWLLLLLMLLLLSLLLLLVACCLLLFVAFAAAVVAVVGSVLPAEMMKNSSRTKPCQSERMSCEATGRRSQSESSGCDPLGSPSVTAISPK